MRVSKKTNRECLVCGTLTNTAYMGVDICRACNVFYRRSLGRKCTYNCRSGSGRCRAGKELSCKKCRLSYLENLVKDSRDEIEEKPRRGTTDVAQARHDIPTNIGAFPPLLSRVKIAYDKLCFARLISELHARKDPPSPMQISSDSFPVYPATYSSMKHANAILLPCILDFGTSCFPEFGLLAREEKRVIAEKFAYAFRKLDNSYRAVRHFANQPDRTFCAYTLYMTENVADNFFSDFDGDSKHLEQAKQIASQFARSKPQEGRAKMDQMMPDEREFLALLAILFWTTNGLGDNDHLARISEHYRQQVSSELHSYYRDVLHLEDYASRMGELFSFLPLFENHKKMKDTVQVFRLLDIFPSDSSVETS